MYDETDSPDPSRAPRGRVGPPGPRGPAPVPISERRVYRAGDTQDDSPRARGDQSRSGSRAALASGAGHPTKRTPILAVVALIAIAVVIALAGVASRDGGLQGSQSETGTFKLLPITTTTTL
jgi:hypothetical protein